MLTNECLKFSVGDFLDGVGRCQISELVDVEVDAMITDDFQPF